MKTGSRELKYNSPKLRKPIGGAGDYDALDNLFKKDEHQTVVLGDGLNYPINAATIVRNGAILGLSTLILSPIPKKVYTDTQEKNPEYAETFLSPFKIQDGKCIYTNKFIKAVSKYSTQHQTCLNVMFNYEAEPVIDLALKHGFKIMMMENDVKGDIFDKDMTVKKILFVVGNERYGVRESIRKMYPEKIEPLYIPSCIDRSSMNVSMAATIAIYERTKQSRCNITKCDDKKMFLNYVPSVNRVDRVEK